MQCIFKLFAAHFEKLRIACLVKILSFLQEDLGIEESKAIASLPGGKESTKAFEVHKKSHKIRLELCDFAFR